MVCLVLLRKTTLLYFDYSSIHDTIEAAKAKGKKTKLKDSISDSKFLG
jgi:hypothetical protein